MPAPTRRIAVTGGKPTSILPTVADGGFMLVPGVEPTHSLALTAPIDPLSLSHTAAPDPLSPRSRSPLAHRAATLLTSLGSVCLAACSGPYSALDPASSSAQAVAILWWCMFAFAALVLLCVLSFWLYAIRRDAAPGDERAARRVQRRWIIGGGLILPIASTTLLLSFGIPIGQRMLPVPPEEGEALVIQVTGHQWWWQVRYPDTAIELRNEIHIPVGQPVDIHLTTADVIHSFWVPRLGGKLDTIPGRTNVLRLQADQPGRYRGQCAEFCGMNHAHMQFTVEAHPPEAFEQWLEARTRD